MFNTYYFLSHASDTNPCSLLFLWALVILGAILQMLLKNNTINTAMCL